MSGISEYSHEVWKYIEKEDNFFYNLEVLEGTKVALKKLEGYGHPCEFLTALPKPTGKLWQAHRDKVEWVRDKLKLDWQVNCVDSWKNKRYFCRSMSDILIDDLHRNCFDWHLAGGVGILHTSWTDTCMKIHVILKP